MALLMPAATGTTGNGQPMNNEPVFDMQYVISLRAAPSSVDIVSRVTADLRPAEMPPPSTRRARGDLDVDQFVWEMFGISLNHHVRTDSHNPNGAKRTLTAFDGLARPQMR
jgi:hypothetical protein